MIKFLFKEIFSKREKVIERTHIRKINNNNKIKKKKEGKKRSK